MFGSLRRTIAAPLVGPAFAASLRRSISVKR
jgi:hypothetical protein